jgi:hypothetical protein
MLIVAKISKGSAGGYAGYLEGKSRASALGDYYSRMASGSRLQVAGRAELACSDSTPACR